MHPSTTRTQHGIKYNQCLRVPSEFLKFTWTREGHTDALSRGTFLLQWAFRIVPNEFSNKFAPPPLLVCSPVCTFRLCLCFEHLTFFSGSMAKWCVFDNSRRHAHEGSKTDTVTAASLQWELQVLRSRGFTRKWLMLSAPHRRSFTEIQHISVTGNEIPISTFAQRSHAASNFTCFGVWKL